MPTLVAGERTQVSSGDVQEIFRLEATSYDETYKRLDTAC